MNKWLREWQEILDGREMHYHLFFQFCCVFFILLISALISFVGSKPGFWDLLLLMIIPAFGGYFLNKHSVEQVRTFFRKKWNKIKS